MTGDGSELLGIFARVFPRDGAAAVARAVADAGYHTVQLNLSCVGLPTIPDAAELETIDLREIGGAFSGAGVSVWGVSLTFNLIHPDTRLRARQLAAAEHYLARIPELGSGFATICTGTRDADNMWRAHADNAGVAAWADLRAGLDRLIAAAGQAGLRLGIEPEHGNVISDAEHATRLLRELGADADHVGIVLDPANLITPDTAAEQERILREAAEALGQHVVCMQAKDIDADGLARPAGTGLLDYDLILDLHGALPRQVPIVVQDVDEVQAVSVRDFLARGLAGPTR